MDYIHWQQTFLIAVIFISVKTLWSTLRRQRASSRNGCSPVLWYPHWDPIFGYDLYCKTKAAKENNSLDKFIAEILSRYGNKKTLMSLTWGLPTLISADPRLLQAVLTTNMNEFGVAPIRRVANEPLFGQDVFVADGSSWKTNRRFVQTLLGRSRFADLSCLEKHVNRLMQLLPTDNKAQVNLQSLFTHMYVDFATEFISGESLGSLTPKPRTDVESFLAALERVNKGIQRRITLAPILKLAGRDYEFEAACKQVHQYFDGYIDKELSGYSETHTERPSTLIRDALDVKQDPVFVRDQLIGFFLPMYSSSVFTLSDVFFHLARAPHVWQTLRREVLAERGKPLTFELLKSTTYLQAVIRESIRLLAPADRIIRWCINDCVLPYGGGLLGDDPIFLQKGTLVDFRSSVLHRNKEFWGEDADLFRPERWFEGNIRPKWEYVPFGGGARICPAQQMILTHYAYILARFALEFETLENRDPCFEFVAEFILSKRSRNGVQVALKRDLVNHM